MLASYNSFVLVMHVHLWAEAEAAGVTQTAYIRQRTCSFGGAIIRPDKLL